MNYLYRRIIYVNYNQSSSMKKQLKEKQKRKMKKKKEFLQGHMES